MNKKLLTVAVAAGVAATSLAAVADVKIYGRVQAELINVDNNTGLSQVEVNDQGQTRWGIKATEKLGKGLTGIAVLEFKVDPTDNATEANRQQFVGLKGNFGTLAMGTFNGPYKSIGTSLDPFNNTFMEARNNGGQSAGAFGHTSFLRNAVAWMSPTVNGISAQVAVIGEDGSGGSDNDWTFAVQYKNGPMWGWVAHSEDESAGNSLTKIGGRMSMGQHSFWLQYEDDDGGLNGPGDKTATTGDSISAPGAGIDGNILLVGYKMKMGRNELVVQYGDSDYDTAAGSGEYIAIGGIHRFSKTTRIFGGWRQTDDDTAADEIDVIGFGIRKDF